MEEACSERLEWPARERERPLETSLRENGELGTCKTEAFEECLCVLLLFSSSVMLSLSWRMDGVFIGAWWRRKWKEEV